jgi:hypothetical protein
MARTFVAVCILVLGGAFTVFAITMAAASAINERCTQEMAWDGNC